MTIPETPITINEDGTPFTISGSGSELVSNPQHQQCLARLQLLEDALIARDPMMKTHLLEIHKQMITYEELVHLLTDEQIGIIMAAQQNHTNTVLVGSASTAAGKKKAIAAGAKLTISDL
jgi:hypothetical protein